MRFFKLSKRILTTHLRAPKLNGILKKYGYKFENGTIIDLDGDADDADATAEVTALKTPKTPRTPKTPKTPKATAKAGKTGSFGKKRSAADMEADSEFNTEAAAGGKIKGEGEGEGDKYDGEAASGGAGEA